jgi:hypothetical protein
MSALGINAADGGKTTRIIAAISAVDKGMVKQLRAEIDTEARSLAKEAQAHLQTMETKGKGSTGLRKRIAAGVIVNRAPGPANRAAVVINTSVAHVNEAPIPLGIETFKGWRHPVFGDREVWRPTRPRFQWFTLTMQSAEGPLTERFSETLDAAAEDIARA